MTLSGTESDHTVPAKLDQAIAISSGIFGFQVQTRMADHVSFLGAETTNRESAVYHDHIGPKTQSIRGGTPAHVGTPAYSMP